MSMSTTVAGTTIRPTASYTNPRDATMVRIHPELCVPLWNAFLGVGEQRGAAIQSVVRSSMRRFR